MRQFLALFASIAIASIAQADPIVMDFESLRVDSAEQVIIHGTSYSEDGFTLSVTCCEPVGGSQSTDLRTSGTLTAIFPGSTAMRGGKSNTLITLTASDGGLFDLLSIDLAALPGNRVRFVPHPPDSSPSGCVLHFYDNGNKQVKFWKVYAQRRLGLLRLDNSMFFYLLQSRTEL